jgi:hypothetical protein
MSSEDRQHQCYPLLLLPGLLYTIWRHWLLAASAFSLWVALQLSLHLGRVSRYHHKSRSVDATRITPVLILAGSVPYAVSCWLHLLTNSLEVASVNQMLHDSLAAQPVDLYNRPRMAPRDFYQNVTAESPRSWMHLQVATVHSVARENDEAAVHV